MTILLKIDPRNPDKETLTETSRILREGGIIAFPTETFYGLGVDARQEAAVEKIFRIKGRNIRNPVSVIVDSEAEVIPLVAAIPEAARVLMKNFWPGPLTLVFCAAPPVSSHLTGGTGKIGIRVSSHTVARLLAKRLSGPLTATSANLSGGQECSTAADVIQLFGDRLDAIVDGGPTPGGMGSTILDITVHPPLVLRTGAVSLTEILESLGIPPC
ncbi:MAG: threonylcarbamoyl-AMP synthase [Syntrophus sp. (in: bacteria)]|nr:threonylcarbamoyl-AMP synthase [Syntrophus sp. (in: bacteria)]